jgi:archaeal flagellar protein FlaH
MAEELGMGMKALRPDLYGIHLKVDELAVRLGGGIPKGSIMFIEGPEGSGRSIISQRLCYGFLKNDASCTYVSTEMTLRDFIDQMYSLEYRVGPYLMNAKLTYFPVYPLIGNHKTQRSDFLDKLLTSPQLYATDTLIIDNLSSLVSAGIDENGCRQLMGFFKKFTRQNKTIILTGAFDDKCMEPIRSACDIYISLSMKPSGEGIKRFMEIKRFARAKGKVDDYLKYRIEPRSGLVIEITEVSG